MKIKTNLLKPFNLRPQKGAFVLLFYSCQSNVGQKHLSQIIFPFVTSVWSCARTKSIKEFLADLMTSANKGQRFCTKKVSLATWRGLMIINKHGY